jgi:formylglycine-generating enzyme required for sulfatase activity
MAVWEGNQKPRKTPGSRADLLDFLRCHGREGLTEMADFAGYIFQEKKSKIKLPLLKVQDQVRSDISSEVEHRFLNKRGPEKFWRVTRHEIKKKDEVEMDIPYWAEGDDFFDEQDIKANTALSPPMARPLLARSRVWPFLKQSLSLSRNKGIMDIEEAVRLISQLKPIRKFPEKRILSWAPNGVILIDYAERLTPFWQDANILKQWIKGMRGTAGLDVFMLEHGPLGEYRQQNDRAAALKNFKLPPPDTPILIISDLGAFDSSKETETAWLRFGRMIKMAGLCPVVITPAPQRYWQKELTRYFQLFPWESGKTRNSFSNEPSGRESFQEPSRLLALLSPSIRVEPGLLRAIRLLLPRYEADSATEALAWNSKEVSSCSLAFTFKPELITEYRNAFLKEPKELRKKVLECIALHHRHLGKAVIHEENLIASALEGDTAIESEEFIEKFYRTMAAARTGAGEKAWVNRVSKRQHPEVWGKYPALTAVWAKNNLEELKKGKISLPQGAKADDIAWMFSGKENVQEFILEQAGDKFILETLEQSREREEREVFMTGSRLAGFISTDSCLEVIFFNGKGEQRDSIMYDFNQSLLSKSFSGKSIHLKSKKISLDKAGSLELGNFHEKITLQPLGMESWAKGMGCDKNGLFAIPAKKEAGARLRWFNPGVHLFQGRGDEENKQKRIHKEQGFWGDSSGVDRYGLYVDYRIKGILLRMRWIEPGRFMMGSPEDEKERDSDEKLHEVILTKGFWLAETQCTQELWEAIMGIGKNPSSFKGKKRPVEKVSWDDCQRFISKFNSIMDFGFRLPTEAEWEYSCRAGTRTPFSFGENITPEQVNYNGDFPYANGRKGKYRKETVEVASLPCNDWGLYEMHGNVWEWCSGWYGEYQDEPVINPQGLQDGKFRVLRGGGWIHYGRRARCAVRLRYDPGIRYDDIGFRLARGH